MATPIDQLKPKIELTPDRNSILMRYLRAQVNGKEGWMPVTNEYDSSAPVAGLPTSSKYVVQGIQHTTDGALDGLYTGQALNWQVRRLRDTITPPPTPMTTTHALVGLDANQPINTHNGDILATINPDLAQNVQIVRINFIVGPYGAPTNPDWKTQYDEIVNRYVNRGIQVYGLIGHQISDHPGSLLQTEAKSVQAEAWVADYVSRFVEIVAHFRNRVKFWESYNEPNVYFNQSAVIHPYWFAKILRDVYQAVKFDRGMGDVTLISGPLFAHNNPNPGDHQPYDNNKTSAQVNFLNNTFAAGKAHHGWTTMWNQEGTYPLDGLGYHLYLHPPRDVASATLANSLKTYLDWMYEAWASHYPPSAPLTKKIYISEFGWQSNDMRDSQQRERMTTAFRLFLSHARVGAAIWFCTQDFNGEGWGIYAAGSLSHPKEAGHELNRIATDARAGAGSRSSGVRILSAHPHQPHHDHDHTNGGTASYYTPDTEWYMPEDDELAQLSVADRLPYVMAKRQQQRDYRTARAELDASPLRSAPIADTFQFPVGRPNREIEQDFYRATFFLDAQYHTNSVGNTWHPGEDWNLKTGGDSDLGEPVYAAANGKVITSDYFSPKWGNIILIEHRLPHGERVWTQYAHLNERYLFAGEIVERGNGIGTIGKGAHGVYSAHLHFEVRKEALKADFWPMDDIHGAASERDALIYRTIKAKYYNPSIFVNERQSPAPRWGHDVVVDSQERNQHAGTFNRTGTPQTWFSAPYGYFGRTLWSPTAQNQETNGAEWRPALRDAGEYQVFVFVPKRNATTTNALYHILHANGESVVSVNQDQFYDVWHSLGSFPFQMGNRGAVRLSNATGEAAPRQIAFDAVRWVRLI